MLSKPIPAWVLGGGFALTAIAGIINAVGFLGFHHQALAHMSGPLTILGNEIAGWNGAAVLRVGTIILGFFLGCVLSAVLIGPGALKLGRRYGVALTLEAAILALAYLCLRERVLLGECLAALACGLQNAMASSYSGAVIRTTHMTGIVTDLGIMGGHLLRGEAVDRRRAGLYALLLGGFLVGAVAGSYGYARVGVVMLLIPAVLTGAGGLGYMIFRNSRETPRE
ncbi:MAG TPA: YoaK family protein [Opitutaceae bacterium]|nr:YoaK family protein [Opitutaceae bacterium]